MLRGGACPEPKPAALGVAAANTSDPSLEVTSRPRSLATLLRGQQLLRAQQGLDGVEVTPEAPEKLDLPENFGKLTACMKPMHEARSFMRALVVGNACVVV